MPNDMRINIAYVSRELSSIPRRALRSEMFICAVICPVRSPTLQKESINDSEHDSEVQEHQQNNEKHYEMFFNKQAKVGQRPSCNVSRVAHR